MRMLMGFGVINFLESSVQFSMPSIRICSYYLCFLSILSLEVGVGIFPRLLRRFRSFPLISFPSHSHSAHSNSYPFQLIPIPTHTHSNSYPFQLIPIPTHTHSNSY